MDVIPCDDFVLPIAFIFCWPIQSEVHVCFEGREAYASSVLNFASQMKELI